MAQGGPGVTDLLDWFGEAGHAAFAAFAVALGSLVVAMVDLVKSSRTQKRLLTIEEQRERDRLAETQKARLTARIVKEPSRNRTPNYYLEIANNGEGEAREIRVTLDGAPVMEHRSVVMTGTDITQIGVRSSARYMLAPTQAIRLPRTVELAWVDDSGEPGHYRTTL
jgi:heme exporter protein D